MGMNWNKKRNWNKKASWNKKAVSLSILILILACVSLSLWSLVYFGVKEGGFRARIYIHTDVDEVYVKEVLIDFYIQDVFDKAVEDLKFENGKEIFIKKFKEKLNELKDKKGKYPIDDLKKIEEQINQEDFESKIDFNEEKLVLSLDIVVKNDNPDERVGAEVTYSYKKDFEKVFK